jgi:hypothetical protein
MSEHDDSHDVDAEVRALLDAGARDVPDYDVRRGLALHLGAIAVPIAAAAASATASNAASAAAPGTLAPAALSSKAWLAWLAIPIAGASVAAALWWNHTFTTDAASNPQRGATTATTQPHTELDAPRATVSPATVAMPTPAVVESVAPPAAGAGAARAASGRAARPLKGASVASERLVLAETDEGASPAATGTPGAVARGLGDSSRPVAAVGVASGAQPKTVDDIGERTKNEELRKERAVVAQTAESDLVRLEMESLMQAKRALSSDPARALAIARDGERQFAKGVLREERQHVLILALIQLGRLDEARRVAAPYIARHPDSPFAERVQKALDAATAKRAHQ